MQTLSEFAITPATLRGQITKILIQNGYNYSVGTDMDEWRDMMRSREAFINAQFEPRNCDQTTCRWLTLFDREGNPASTIAWRMLETENFVHAIEGGRLWLDDPTSRGWVHLPSGLNPSEVQTRSGWVCVRGGLKSMQSGNRLSWYLTGLHWTYTVDEDADYTISTAFSDIAGAKLPERLYGYAHTKELPHHFYAQVRRWLMLTLVWSSRDEAMQEIRRRSEFLRTCDAEDLRSTVLAFERQHVA